MYWWSWPSARLWASASASCSLVVNLSKRIALIRKVDREKLPFGQDGAGLGVFKAVLRYIRRMSGGIARRYSVGLWLTAGALAFLLCLYHLSATFIDGAFVPADHDSFYHARRILDALGDPLRMYQFDARSTPPKALGSPGPGATTC